MDDFYRNAGYDSLTTKDSRVFIDTVLDNDIFVIHLESDEMSTLNLYCVEKLLELAEQSSFSITEEGITLRTLSFFKLNKVIMFKKGDDVAIQSFYGKYLKLNGGEEEEIFADKGHYLSKDEIKILRRMIKDNNGVVRVEHAFPNTGFGLDEIEPYFLKIEASKA